MKYLRSDLVSVAVVAAAIGGVAAVFPFEALTFRAAPARPADRPFASFVALDAKDEAAAMKAAKSSWNAEAGAVRRMQAELFVRELPKGREVPELDVGDRLAQPGPALVAPGLSPYLPSMAAPPPAAIAPEGEDAPGAAAPTFPRDELLRLPKTTSNERRQ